MEPIDETLKKIAAGISKANTQTSSNTNAIGANAAGTERSANRPGDPNCPVCGGIGFVRRDLPVGHPEFGRVDICQCRQKEVMQMTHQRLYRLSNLEAFQGMTFENFNTKGLVEMSDHQLLSLNAALNGAQYFAQHLDGWLLLLGSYGVGKTHPAVAIANFGVSIGVPTLFLTAPDLLDWLRYAYGSEDANFETRFEEIRNTKLLIIDDLGTQNATPWAEEKLYQIFNYRYVNRLPTVITANQKLDDIEGRIQSRLRDPELVRVIRIESPDHRNPAGNSTRRQLSSLEFHREQTFGNFSVRELDKLPADEQKSLQKAFNAAQSFAENPSGWIVFTGTYGCGKTHLAAAIANSHTGISREPLFVVVPDLLDHLRSTFGPNSNATYDELFEEVRSAPLLVLDDLGTQSATPWAREKLYQILNHRYVAGLPTVITTANSIDEVDPRVRSRMLDTRRCSIYAITVPPYRGAASGAEKTRRSRLSR
ncbi:MAG: ATP-binding protein [Anaerolineaceae bacterium]|nr:ATP-binding protein [Anaerolineaceae bacterium]